MAAEDALDIFGGDPFGRDYLYGLSTGRDGQGLAPYGFRYAESVNQPTTAKGRGYLGNVGTMQDPMTELSASSDFGGRTVRYPLIVPTLTADELNLLRSGGEPTQEIYGKAQQYALGRLSRGQDPFATTQDLRYPQPQAVDTRPYDQMQATPRGFTSGLFSDVLGRTLNMPSLPRTGIPALDLLYMNRNPVLNMMGVGDVQKTAERISYGQPLTTGSGMTLKPREEAVFAGMAVAPFVGEAVNLGARAGRVGARMVGQRIAENVTMGRPNLPSMLAEPRSSLFAVEPSALMPKPQAPVSELGFYSAAEQAALNLPRNKGTGQSFLNDLMKAPDVKKDELSWIGLDDFLKDKPNVTKQEVQDFIASNKIDLQEVSYGKIDFTKLPDQQLQKEYVRVRGYEPLDSDGSLMSREEIIYELSGAPATDLTRYSNYQLAGGENYREILLKLPKESPTTNDIATKLFGKEMRFLSESEKDAVVAEARRIEDTTPKDYVTTHFREPNILAHMRVNDRVDADGKKMLLVEELQSDWHQAGRERGYATKDVEKAKQEFANYSNELADKYDVNPAQNIAMYATMKGIKPEEIARYEQLQSAYAKTKDAVPDAPFKDTWYQLALKRVMKYAADNGYERVGLTTGKQQADRYKLSNEVDEINVIGRFDARTGEKSRQVALDLKSGGSYKLGVNNEGIIDNVNMLEINNLQGKKLSEVVGKDIAKKIMESNSQTIKGEGLNIGGEGMKKYYDEIYPKFLEKYGKKWDASVGETNIITEDNAWNMAEQIKQRGISDAQWRALSEEDKLKLWNDIKQSVGRKQEPVRYIDITPKMKEGVKKGQPLAAAEQTPEMLASGGLDYADPFRNPLLESSIG